jgi:hypothetical protein
MGPEKGIEFAGRDSGLPPTPNGLPAGSGETGGIRDSPGRVAP